MEKNIMFLICCLVFNMLFAQQIEIKEDIAYVDSNAYVKIEKKGKKKYFIYDISSGEKVLKITHESVFNSRNENYDVFLRIHFLPLHKKLDFYNLTVHNANELIKYLYSESVLVKHNSENIIKTLTRDYTKLSASAKCNKIFKNGFLNIVNDYFVSSVKNDTLVINEIKYRCVNSSFYIQKAMFDRYGMWNKVVFPFEGARNPNLIWNNIKLFESVDKKFTIIARGFEGKSTIYASVMVFDEQGNDMFSIHSNYRERLTTLFGNFIKNNSGDRQFYETYWTTFNPKYWKKIQQHKQTKFR